jgi:hypothetical protein
VFINQGPSTCPRPSLRPSRSELHRLGERRHSAPAAVAAVVLEHEQLAVRGRLRTLRDRECQVVLERTQVCLLADDDAVLGRVRARRGREVYLSKTR